MSLCGKSIRRPKPKKSKARDFDEVKKSDFTNCFSWWIFWTSFNPRISKASLSRDSRRKFNIAFYHINCDVIRGFLALRKAVTTQVKNECWYSQSAADTSLAFSATRSGWWMNNKAFTILNISTFLELLELWRRKHFKKICIADKQWGSSFPRRERKPIHKRKTERYEFSGVGVGISLGWEWKSTTGRFAARRFWPFTWETSSVGKDKFNKWEVCKLKITTIVIFLIMIQRIFPS